MRKTIILFSLISIIIFILYFYFPYYYFLFLFGLYTFLDLILQFIIGKGK